MDEWQSIETAPKYVPIIVFGYNLQGEACPTGPYKYYYVTLGELDDCGCDDLLQTGCDCIAARPMKNPTHWMPLPSPPEKEKKETS